MKRRKRTQAQKYGTQSGYARARALKTYHQARLAKLDADEREGKLVSLDFFVRVHSELVAELRARIVTAPGRWAHRLVGVETIAQAQDRMREVCNDLLSLLQTAAADLRELKRGKA